MTKTHTLALGIGGRSRQTMARKRQFEQQPTVGLLWLVSIGVYRHDANI